MAASKQSRRPVPGVGSPDTIPRRPARGSFRGRSGQVLIALGFAGLLLFNFPLLLIWDQGGTLFGLPSLPVALFLIWGALIAALAWVVERGGVQRLPDASGDGAAPDDTPEDMGGGR